MVGSIVSFALIRQSIDGRFVIVGIKRFGESAYSFDRHSLGRQAPGRFELSAVSADPNKRRRSRRPRCERVAMHREKLSYPSRLLLSPLIAVRSNTERGVGARAEQRYAYKQHD